MILTTLAVAIFLGILAQVLAERGKCQEAEQLARQAQSRFGKPDRTGGAFAAPPLNNLARLGILFRDLIPGADIAGAAAFLDYAADADVSLFV